MKPKGHVPAGKTSGGHPKTNHRRYQILGPNGLALALDKAAPRFQTRSRGSTALAILFDWFNSQGIVVPAAEPGAGGYDKIGPRHRLPAAEPPAPKPAKPRRRQPLAKRKSSKGA